MVKKSSILNKIVDRFRSGPVRVESDRTEAVEPAEPRSRLSQAAKAQSARPGAGAQPASKPEPTASKPATPPEPARPAPEARVPVQHVPEEIIPKSRRKLSASEDAAMQMSKGLTELSSLLRGVQVRMEDQGSKLDAMGGEVNKLPVVAEAQLEVLKRLADQLAVQNELNGNMAKAFVDLPDVMKGVQKSLERSAATDERTATTLSEFKSTMSRIQGSMGEMVEASRAQTAAANNLSTSHKKTVESTVEQIESSTQKSIDALRAVQEDQSNRIAKIVGEGGRWNRAVLVMMILSFAALVAIFAALISGK